MDFTYTLEAKHFHDFNTAATRELAYVNSLKGQLIWGVIVGSCIAVAASAARVLIDVDEPIILCAFGAGAWFFWLINYITTIFLVRRFASKAFRQNGLMLGARLLSIDDIGLHVKSDSFSQDVYWQAIKSISVQHLVVVLWTDTAAGIFVPRSAFDRSEQEQRFVSIVQTKIALNK
jgi:hypothetical protein